MADMPQVNPRNMSARIGQVLDTHQQIKQGMQERAMRLEQQRVAHDQHLNAQARLDGKTK